MSTSKYTGDTYSTKKINMGTTTKNARSGLTNSRKVGASTLSKKFIKLI